MIRNQIWFIAWADFKERTRRFSFLVLCALSVLAAFLFVPNPNAEITSITVDTTYFSQATNWTWVPMASALCTGVLLPLIGFFYLRNSLNLDTKTGVAHLIHTSPVSGTIYLSGKYISNVLILFCMLLIVTLSSFCMALLHFPDTAVSVLQCFSYSISMIPGIFLCAALALMTEATPLFQSRIGVWLAGILYFVLYIIHLSSLFDNTQGILVRLFDMTGILWLKDSINQSVYGITRNPAHIALIVHESGMINNLKLPELFFAPLSFTSERLFEKLWMIVLGIVICVAASFILPRYENARKVNSIPEKIHRNSNGHRLFITELILTFRNCSTVWFLMMSALWASLFFADLETAQGILWILSIAWACILFSDYGCREKRNNLDSLLPTLYHAYPLQLLVRFVVGGVISFLVSAPVILRTVLTGDFSGAAAGILFALFIPALSIFLGKISGSERLFEVIFLIICYVMLNTSSVFLLNI